MKITKSDLAQIIKEELSRLNENPNETSDSTPFGAVDRTTTQVRQDAFAASKEQGAGGITPRERGLIKQLNDLLVAGSTDSNILGGQVLIRIKSLAAALEKVIKNKKGSQDV